MLRSSKNVHFAATPPRRQPGPPLRSETLIERLDKIPFSPGDRGYMPSELYIIRKAPVGMYETMVTSYKKLPEEKWHMYKADFDALVRKSSTRKDALEKYNLLVASKIQREVVEDLADKITVGHKTWRRNAIASVSTRILDYVDAQFLTLLSASKS